MLYLCVKQERTRKAPPDAGEAHRRLQGLRLSLLALHKALVDSERVQYEKAIGRIQSPNHFLQLLTTDPWFAWLSPLSQLIVSMDEALDAEEPLSVRSADAMVRQTANLLKASQEGSAFAMHYYEALQRDPDVVLAHAEVTRVPGWPRSGAPDKGPTK